MLKDEFIHLTLSIIAGLIIYAFTGNAWVFGLAVLSGFAIDGDHLIDYFIYLIGKKKKFSLAEFFKAHYFDEQGKVYLFLHGFEYAAVLIILGFFISNLNWLFWPLGLSLIFHLIYDTISNKPIWPTYFISFRISKNFNHQAFCFKCHR